MKRVILDTNLWISFLITKNYSKPDDILFSRQCVLVFSNELLEEFLEVARRPKFRRFFTSSDIEDILETLDEYADFIKLKQKLTFAEILKIIFYFHLPSMVKPIFC